MLGDSFSTIAADSPKVRPWAQEKPEFSLRHLLNSKTRDATLKPPVPESLSSTAIDRALSDPDVSLEHD